MEYFSIVYWETYNKQHIKSSILSSVYPWHPNGNEQNGSGIITNTFILCNFSFKKSSPLPAWFVSFNFCHIDFLGTYMLCIEEISVEVFFRCCCCSFRSLEHSVPCLVVTYLLDPCYLITKAYEIYYILYWFNINVNLKSFSAVCHICFVFLCLKEVAVWYLEEYLLSECFSLQQFP